MLSDSYKTVLKPSDEVLFKDRNSKFYGYAFPVSSEEHVKQHLTHLRKQHPTAGHFCYAYQLGIDSIAYRANDDGEPNNSAGMPIYGQIQAFELTNILVVVVRYFGGTKLGVGGLINAYKTTASLTLETAQIAERTLNRSLLISCGYDHLNKVMRIIKENSLEVMEQDLQLDCNIKIEVRLKDAETIYAQFNNSHPIVAKFID